MKIILKGRIPSKKNSRIHTRTGMSFPSSKYTAWHKDASQQLKSFQKDSMEIPRAVSITFFFPDKRRTDLSNKTESIMDLLVDNGFLADDSWQVVNKLELIAGGIDRENPRAEITL